ncbi:patatin-like phospholipase family protein [Thiocapsa bogorovii]|uniref:patatin-like phospholipase family protein n=1 Tax=Thiocapsa bogorovii TaxID=521689 RepID=UPI001E591E0C|nr:patatin-like phospholipase family protein [Thiocapsa bogorovii]UHD16573.1 patatin-like phospholipase family protein [Thiocapsa bogorovii]
MARRESKTLSLALGSGGARGLAHIGIIEWLTEHGYRIGSISGASMGALVGGIYAAGELDAYKRWVCALRRGDVLRFVDLAFSGAGLIKGDRIIDALRSMVGEHSIEDLAISYTAIATDIDRQREVWISQGPLFDAIRASIAVPGVFTPHHYRGLTLVDGGLLNPVPIAPTFRDFTDLTVAVNLNAQSANTDEPTDDDTGTETRKDTPAGLKPNGETSSELSYQERIRQFLEDIGDSLTASDEGQIGVFDLTLRSFETMQNAIAAVKLAAYRPDVVINVPRDACSAHEFHRAEELIALGYRLAEEAMRSCTK